MAVIDNVQDIPAKGISENCTENANVVDFMTCAKITQKPHYRKRFTRTQRQSQKPLVSPTPL